MMFSISVPDVAFQGLDATQRRLAVAQYLQAIASEALMRAVAGEPMAWGGVTFEGCRAVARWYSDVEEYTENCEGVTV